MRHRLIEQTTGPVPPTQIRGTNCVDYRYQQALRASSFDGVPIRIYYGTEDRVSDPAIVREFARRVERGRDPQVDLRQIRGADHGDALVGRVPIQDLVGFVEDHHPPGRI